ncbi:MAG: SPFH domain-containing protein [Myxococcales bacterium]
MSASESNSYLGEVLQRQQKVESDLKRKRAMPMSQMPMQQAMNVPAPARAAAPEPMGGDAGGGGAGRGVDFRITGWWRWKTVVVPPNVYVVHTRRGAEKPVHIGMGVSFSFNPYTDAFLIIPAAMQTIVINARCICTERQGILVQAYVQWIIDDIETAYKKLDFSDTEDPMRIVNVQLREQAEAAIKDKVATLRIDEVLADKQPIIEELTTRLRGVAEGNKGSGLGLKIVTVQIKEAVVSSTRLWENLQKPFRAERERLARMAELETERQIASRELEIRQARETAEIETERAISKNRAEAERETYDRSQAEAARRSKVELETERNAIVEKNATQKAKQQGELELALHKMETEEKRLKADVATLAQQKAHDLAEADRKKAMAQATLALEEEASKAKTAIAERELALLKTKREIENQLSEANVRTQLIAKLPEIASKLPAPKELRSVSISGDGGPASQLTGLLESVMALLEARKATVEAPEKK